VSPIEIIKEKIKENHWTQKQFAVRMDMSKSQTNRLINGKIPISYEIAYKLQFVVGESPRYWLDLDRKYREKSDKKED